jgi:hypothetical protein
MPPLDDDSLFERVLETQRRTDEANARRRPRWQLIGTAPDEFLSDTEIVARLAQYPLIIEALFNILEQHNLPPVDPQRGGRYRPDVLFWLNARLDLAENGELS